MDQPDVQMYPVALVRVNEGRRALDEKFVRELIDSIPDVGLRHPITVNEDGTLIDGRHRLEAFRMMGRESIPAIVELMDETRAALTEIDTNLVSNPPKGLERAELLSKRKVYYERLHPETRAGVAGGKASGTARSDEGRTTADSAVVPTPSVASFVADTAAKTGRSERAIYEDVQIAEDIIPEVKEMIRKTPVAEHKTDLMEIARTEPERQPEVAQVLIADRQLAVLDTTAYRAKRREMREERERTEAEAAAQQAMIEATADPKGIFARNETREAYREHLGVVRSFVAVDPEILLPALSDADRTFIEAFLPSIRKWCDAVESVLRPGPRRMRG